MINVIESIIQQNLTKDNVEGTRYKAQGRRHKAQERLKPAPLEFTEAGAQGTRRKTRFNKKEGTSS
jgi:hypothetical protein